MSIQRYDAHEEAAIALVSKTIQIPEEAVGRFYTYRDSTAIFPENRIIGMLTKSIADHERKLAAKDTEIERLKRKWDEAVTRRNTANEKRNALMDKYNDLKAQVERLSAPVSDEDAERSFHIWNGISVDATKWVELDEVEQERWKLAIIASRAAKEKGTAHDQHTPHRTR